MNRFLKMLLIPALVAAGSSSAVVADDGTAEKRTPRTGSIRGQVFDAETGTPLIGVSVRMVGTQQGAATDSLGAFRIADCPVGSYAVQFSTVGYRAMTQTDVIVRAGRTTVFDARLRVLLIEMKGVKVSGGYFSDDPSEPTSSTTFSTEEVRRSPASAEDVSRIMLSLPSIAKVNDQVNNLIVRGGSPTENSFYVDNIEIPNINHYPLFGTSGGPISLINTDFIKNVTFSAGGFSAAYGDRLSSIMSLSFREGNRDDFGLQADFNMAGVGLVGEGPIAARGSWMVSARRSYLDLLVKAIGVGVVPRYSDYQGKVVFDLSPRHQLSALGIVGVDYINFSREEAVEESNTIDGWSDGYEYAFGVNWRYLWGGHGYSNTSISYLATRIKANYFETSTGEELVRQNDLNGSANVRNVNFYRISDNHGLEFGAELKQQLDDFDYYAAAYTDYFGGHTPTLVVDNRITSPELGGFISYIASPTKRLTATLGIRSDYFEYTGHTSLSPRTALSWRLSDRTTLTGAFGIYSQTVPLVLLSQQTSNRRLKDPQAYHYVAGTEYMLNDNTRLRIESYYKWYKNFPLDVNQPQMFIIDEMIYANYFYYHRDLRDDGRARSYGIEATVQQKLKQRLYGLVSASWFRSQYRDLNGVWRNRSFDNRLLFSAEGGYKPSPKWEYSLRWIYAGGAPYTPLNIEASRALDRSVYDETRVNESRYPAYHSLNLRADRSFNFRNSNLIIYFSVWNAYNRKNLANLYWNEVQKKQQELYQWSLMPVIGAKYEF